MRFRYAIGALLLALSASAAPSTKKAPPKTVKKTIVTVRMVADHVFSTGMDIPISTPLSRNLGYTIDEVPTKALRHKASVSPDKRSHAFHVISSPDKDGKITPTEIVLASSLVLKKDAGKSVDGFFARADLNGKLIAAVVSQGPEGHTEERALPIDSTEAIMNFKTEMALQLEKMDFKKLSR